MTKSLNVKKKVKVPEEKATRNFLVGLARQIGVEDQLFKIFHKYDSALKGAKTPEEHHHISAAGAAEVYKLLGIVNPLIVNGKEILPGHPGWEKEVAAQQNLVKLD